MSSDDRDGLILTVIIYRPLQGGNYHHWGLDVYTQRTDDHCIFQTEGAANHLYPVVYSYDADLEEKTRSEIEIGRLEEAQWSELHKTIKGVRMQNEVSSWDCQEYVLDIMNALEERGLLGSLETYGKVKAAVKSMRGDIDSVQHAVARYGRRDLNDEVEMAQSEGEESVEGHDSENDGSGNGEMEHNYKSAELIEDSDDE